MSSRFERLGNTAFLVLMAVAVAVLVKNSFFSKPAPAAGDAPRAEFVKDWDQLGDSVKISVDPPAQKRTLEGAYATMGHGEDAPKVALSQFALDIAVFTDFECVACRHNDSVLTQISKEFLVQRHIIHWPLRGHKYALAAARAFECADNDGQGSEMRQTLYKYQDDFAQRSWTRLAAEAQVEDTTQFAQCMASFPDSRIQAGTRLAERLKLRGTPTVVVNGWIISPSTPERLREAIQNIIRRRNP